jgi:hypothetical protein
MHCTMIVRYRPDRRDLPDNRKQPWAAKQRHTGATASKPQWSISRYVGTPTHTSNFCTIRGFHTPRVGRAHFPGNLLGAPELESGSQLNHQLDSGKNMHKLIIGSALLAVSAPAFAAECYIVQNPRTKV